VLKRNRRLSPIGVVFILLVFLSINFYPVPISLSDSLGSATRSFSQNYTTHDPIEITNDEELAGVANSGTGTSENPFVIGGWSIMGYCDLGVCLHGISITGTTNHFRIENCWIESSVGFAICGIYVENVASGTTTIINNTCNNNYFGISLGNANSSTVANNTYNSNTWNGISLKDSGFSTITNNICTSNNETGIYLEDSGSSTIANNTCNNNGGRDIEIVGSSSSTVVNNTTTKRGIRLEESTHSTITNNICFNGVIILEDSGFLTVTNNICNGSIGRINAAILLDDSVSSTVANNTCANAGIFIRGSDSSIIANNTCTDAWVGIHVGYANSSTVANNICSNNYHGIYFYSSNFSIAVNNTCARNDKSGIFLRYSGNNSIVWNLLYENTDYGIVLSEGSDNNLIHHNSFISNGLNKSQSQACDNGTHNQWYDDTVFFLEGNFWSDYSGTGNYPIDGTAGAVDPYPNTRKINLEALFSLLIRIILFLSILGLLLVSIFLNRRKKSI
jgi:parallel beta-helix repeat protein